MKVHPYRTVFSQPGAVERTVESAVEPSMEGLVQSQATRAADVTVCISLYNYESRVVETLNSVVSQTQTVIDLVIVEDCSPDNSLSVAMQWLQNNSLRFNAIQLLQHTENRGLSAARNTAISASTTPYIFILDADNLLYPRCVERCVEALQADPEASVAYPIIEKFGEEEGLIGNVVWNPERFKVRNCIDAMSLIRRQALLAVEGYSELEAVGRLGWEDYELWCKFIDRKMYGVPVPEILARYRTHQTSMLNSVSNQQANIAKLHREMMILHPWLELPVL